MDNSQSVVIISDEDDGGQEIDEADGKLLQSLQLFNGDLSQVCKNCPEFNKRVSYRKLKTYLQTIRGCEKLATFFNNPSIREAASVEDLLQAIDTTQLDGFRVKREKKRVEEEEEEEEEEKEQVQVHKEALQKELGKEEGAEEERVLLRRQPTQEQEGKRVKLFEVEMRRRELSYHAEMEERRNFEEEMNSLYKEEQAKSCEDILKESEEKGRVWREEPQSNIEALFTDKLMLTRECVSLKENISVLQKEYTRAIASNNEITEMLQQATADLEKARKSLADALKDNKRAEASVKRITDIVTAYEARESKFEERSDQKGARKKKAGTQKNPSSSTSKLSKQTKNVATISEDHSTSATPSSTFKSTFTLRSSKK